MMCRIPDGRIEDKQEGCSVLLENSFTDSLVVCRKRSECHNVLHEVTHSSNYHAHNVTIAFSGIQTVIFIAAENRQPGELIQDHHRSCTTRQKEHKLSLALLLKQANTAQSCKTCRTCSNMNFPRWCDRISVAY